MSNQSFSSEQLRTMSDHEINSEVAEIIFRDTALISYSDVDVMIHPHGGSGGVIFDPCNDWNDVMPISKEYRISIDYLEENENYWEVFRFPDVYEGKHVNEAEGVSIQRAVCEVFLMMER